MLYLLLTLALLVDNSHSCSMPSNSEGHKREPILVSMAVVLDDSNRDDYALDIKLANKSRIALKVYDHSLPWKAWHSMLLIAVITDAGGTSTIWFSNEP